MLDGGDVLLGGRTVPGLAAGASHTATTTVTVPAGTATGIYYLIARADADQVVGETSEANNTAFTTLLIGSDLLVTTLTLPSTAAAGATLTVSDTTRNQGTGAAAASTTRFYLSRDTALDAGDTPLGGRAVPPLAGGASSAGSTAVTIPVGTASGTYYVIAKADADDAVLETVETNNTAVRTLQIGGDLVVASLVVPPTAGAGVPMTVTDTTRNAGSGAVEASTTSLYLSTNAILDAADIGLGSRAVPALAAGAASTGSTTVTLPAGLAPGIYFVIAKADADLVVGESQETNNTSYAAVQIGADLVVAALGVPSGAGPGATISVTDTTKNQGGGTADATTTAFYLSTTPSVGAGSVWLGSRAVPALTGGASHAASTPLVIPAGTGPGSYYLIARADADGVAAETQEGNNTTFGGITIGADLVIGLVMGPSLAGAGDTINVTDTTRNAGGGAADATTTAFYLSTNGTLDAADVLLGSRPVPPLAGGAADTATTALVVPVGTAPGNYSILARADATGAAVESQETNNVSYTGISIGPDLIVIPPSAPTSAAAGATITVGDTTLNVGGGPADGSTTSFYLSRDAALDAGDVLVGSREVPPLAARANHAGSTAVTIPPGTAPGTYYLIAKADAGALVAESVETNNTSSRTIQITP